MLVLSRKQKQTICIADNIVVTVLEIRDGKVRLGVTAPRDVDVHRGEIRDRIRRQQESPTFNCEPLLVQSGLIETEPVAAGLAESAA